MSAVNFIESLTRQPGKFYQEVVPLMPDDEDYRVQPNGDGTFVIASRPTRVPNHENLGALVAAVGLSLTLSGVVVAAYENRGVVAQYFQRPTASLNPPIDQPTTVAMPEAAAESIIEDPDSVENRLFFIDANGETSTKLTKAQETASILFDVASKLGKDPFELIYTSYFKTGLNPDAAYQGTVIIGNRVIAGPTEEGPLLIAEDVLQKGWEEYAKFNGVPAECGTKTIQGCFIHIKAKDPKDAAIAVESAVVWNPALAKWGPLPNTAKDYDFLLKYLKQNDSEAVSLIAFDGSRIDMKIFPLINRDVEPQYIQAERPAVLDLVVPEGSVTFDQMHPEIPDVSKTAFQEELTIVQLGDRILQIGNIVIDFNITTALQAAASIAQSREPINSPQQMSAQEKYLEAQRLIPKIEALISATGRNPQIYMKIMFCESSFNRYAENNGHFGLAQFLPKTWVRLTGLNPADIWYWDVHTLAFVDAYDRSPGEWECKA